MGDYRADIQILRGFAISLVLLFHLNIPYFSGGFVGVDIFFVVSGYLMAFSFRDNIEMPWLDFYRRRARRILPAYFLVALVTLLTGAFLVLPHEVADMARATWYTLLGMPNVGFWMDNSYFQDSLFRPMLHFWSLGVELQFYLLVPFIILFYRKYRYLVWLAAALTLVACIAMTGISPKTAFFLTPFRLWEFLCGFLIAQHAIRPAASGLRPWLGMTALTFLAALPISGIVEEGGFPGYYALGITLLTGAVLLFGLPLAVTGSWVGKGAALIGRYSYSLYLVHFPIIVFWFHQPFSGNWFAVPKAADIISLLVIIALSSALCFHLVEEPFRRPPGNPRLRACLYAAAIGALICAAALTPSLRMMHYSEAEQKIISAWFDRAVYRCGKFRRLAEPRSRSCTLISGPDNAPVYLLVGNSHADALKTVLAESAKEKGATLRMFKQSCAPGQGACALQSVIDEIRLHDVVTVILHSSPNSMVAADIARFVAAGQENGFNVALIDPVPVWDRHVPATLLAEKDPAARSALFRQTQADYMTKNRELFDALLPPTENFSRHAVKDVLCDPHCAVMDREGRPLYFDSGHLTLTGAALLKKRLSGIFDTSSLGATSSQ